MIENSRAAEPELDGRIRWLSFVCCISFPAHFLYLAPRCSDVELKEQLHIVVVLTDGFDVSCSPPSSIGKEVPRFVIFETNPRFNSIWELRREIPSTEK